MDEMTIKSRSTSLEISKLRATADITHGAVHNNADTLGPELSRAPKRQTAVPRNHTTPTEDPPPGPPPQAPGLDPVRFIRDPGRWGSVVGSGQVAVGFIPQPSYLSPKW